MGNNDDSTFFAQLFGWLVCSLITVVVCFFGAWFPITWLAVAGIMLIWAVIIFGGILILDDLDTFF
jgi:hypothetical protein